MTLRLGAKIEGSIEQRLDEDRAGMARRMRAGLDRASRAVQLKLRDDVARNLNSKRLPTTWRRDLYPANAAIPTLGPAALIFSKAPEIILVFSDGATIVPTVGRNYLWIPTADCPRDGRRAMKPSDVEKRFGGFGFAPTAKGAIAYVMAKRRRSRSRASEKGRIRSKSSRGGEVERIVVFILVRRVTLRPRLRTAAIMAEARATWATALAQAVAQSK